MKKEVLLLLILLVPSIYAADGISIRNLGLTGIERSNPEYTSVRSVFLELNYSDAVQCRYTNYDDPTQWPPYSYSDWTYWETCVDDRLWELTEGEGQKTVYYHINKQNSPIMYLSFDEGSNSTFTPDISGYSIDGQPVDADTGNGDGDTPPTWYNSGGVIGGYYDFDGVDDWMRTDSSDVLHPDGNAISLEAWVRFNNAFVADSKVFSKTGLNLGYTFRIDDGDPNRLEMYIGDGSTYHFCNAAHGMETDWWYHVVGVYNSTDFNLYVNGTKIGSCSDIFTPDWGSSGGIALAPIIFEASLDEVKVYDFALSDQQVLNNYNSGVSGQKTPVDLILNDSIYYDYTGGGLDTTPPYPAQIDDGEYTNNAQQLTVTWSNASDPESEVLDIPLQYNYTLYNNDTGIVLDNVLTTATEVTSTFSAQAHASLLLVNLTVINSAGLKANSTSDGVIIDLVAPTVSTPEGSFLNLSNGQYQPVIAGWMHANKVNFSWIGSDALSYVDAYSYSLSQDASAEPDNLPDGSIQDLANSVATSIAGLRSATYYFKVKARDIAGNWGSSESLTVSVDSTGAVPPQITSETKKQNNISYTWNPVSDAQSGFAKYMINISDGQGFEDSVMKTAYGETAHTFEGLPTGDYDAIVGVLNGAGIWSWSNQAQTQADFTPPQVDVYPTAEIMSNTFKVSVFTDEYAECFYNITGGTRQFSYTNTTYHESRLSLSDGGYTYNITCVDGSGNRGGKIASFTVNSQNPDTLTAPISHTATNGYPTTFVVDLSNGATSLAGADSDSFTIYVNGQQTRYNVFDQGTGEYNISIIPIESGSIPVRVVYDGLEDTFTMDISDLELTGWYQDAGLTPRITDQRVYSAQAGRAFGLATDSDNSVIQASATVLNISQVSDRLYIFNTRDDLRNVDRLLESEEFLQVITPAFAYPLDDVYKTRFMLAPRDYTITSNIGDELAVGRHSFIMRRQTNNRGEKQIVFTNQ